MGRVHARLLASLEGLDLVGVVDADAGASDSLAAQLDVEAIHPLRLADRSDLEAWVIATPTDTHHSIALAALEAGVHVLCEKPLTLDPVRDVELEALARTTGRILQVGFWRRFSPPWAEAKRLIAAGAIGRPIYLRFSQWDADPPPPEFCSPEVSGGLAIDCGVHEFDLAEWLTGSDIVSVQGHDLPIVDAAVGEAGDVDNLIALLHLSGGAAASVDLSRNGRYGDDVRTEILGEDGAIFVEMLPRARARLAGRSGIETIGGSEVGDAMLAGLTAQAQAFHRLVRGADIDHPGAEASRRAVVVGRAVQRSAGSRHPVAFS